MMIYQYLSLYVTTYNLNLCLQIVTLSQNSLSCHFPKKMYLQNMAQFTLYNNNQNFNLIIKLQYNKMKLRRMATLLLKKPMFRFSQEQNPNKFVHFIKSAWKQTFPEEQDKVKLKYQAVKQQKHYTKQELQKIQAQMPQYVKGAIVPGKEEVIEEKQGFKISNLIPESVKNKIQETEQYKQYQIFKQNLKEYASTREGALANAGTTVYSKIAQGSPQARATQLMRRYIKDFSLYELEEQSTVIFKNAYHAFLNQKLSELQKMSSQQGYEYFSGHIKVFRTKKWKPKITEIVFNYPAQLAKARVGQNSLPKFDFNIKIIQIYCFTDVQGKVVEGSEDRVQESVFEFTLTYGGEYVAELGHPWTLCEIREVQKMMMLV